MFLLQSGIIPLTFLPTSGLFSKDATHIYKYIKQERIKSQLVNLFRECAESVPNSIIHDPME